MTKVTYPKELLVDLAARAEEARGLLELIRPLCKKPAARLTEAEATVLRDTISQADGVLREAMGKVYIAEMAAYTAKDAARNGIAIKKG